MLWYRDNITLDIAVCCDSLRLRLSLLTYIPHPLPVLSWLFAVGIKNKIKLLYENKVGRDLQGAHSFDCHVFSLLTKYTASVFPDNDRWHIML